MRAACRYTHTHTHIHVHVRSPPARDHCICTSTDPLNSASTSILCPQVQERLTKQIAQAVDDAVKPLGVAVVIEATYVLHLYYSYLYLYLSIYIEDHSSLFFFVYIAQT